VAWWLIELKDGGSSRPLPAFPSPTSDSLLASPLFLPTSWHKTHAYSHLSQSSKKAIVSKAFPRSPSKESSLYTHLLPPPHARPRLQPPKRSTASPSFPTETPAPNPVSTSMMVASQWTKSPPPSGANTTSAAPTGGAPNDCYYRIDLQSAAEYYLASCVSNSCTVGDSFIDILSAGSIYEYYYSSKGFLVAAAGTTTSYCVRDCVSLQWALNW
jgi:hypothetical protein